MNGYLLDTNVLSEVMKKRPSPTVIRRLHAAPRGRLYSSSICVMELRFGAARHPRKDRLWKRIEGEVLSAVQILNFGTAEAETAGDVLALLEAAGRGIGIEDVLIGSTALVRDLVLVTRNTRHLSRIPGLGVENWWD